MNNFTPDWTEGYIAEVEYTAGFYQELSPSHLAFATLLAGFQAPAVDQPFTYCELGCGKGVTVNLIAAANPQGRFYANDFNPAHIVHARGLAAEAGLDNLTVLEKSFTELGQEALPDFDYRAAWHLFLGQRREPARHRRVHPPQAEAGRRGLCQLQLPARLGRGGAAAPPDA